MVDTILVSVQVPPNSLLGIDSCRLKASVVDGFRCNKMEIGVIFPVEAKSIEDIYDSRIYVIRNCSVTQGDTRDIFIHE